MIQPSVGRVVLYHPTTFDTSQRGMVHSAGQPFSATIAYVWGDRCVNLSVTDHEGKQWPVTSVPLAQDDDVVIEGMAEWMPYQKGQAVKTEQLEKELAEK